MRKHHELYQINKMREMNPFYKKIRRIEFQEDPLNLVEKGYKI